MLTDLIRRASKRELGRISSTLGTTTVVSGTGFADQRLVDRCQNGVLWAFYRQTPLKIATPYYWLHAYYSTDDGLTWTEDIGVFNFFTEANSDDPANFTMFIDVDDYIHVAYKNISSGHLMYSRGTPNVSRTAWTWATPVEVLTEAANVNVTNLDLVAHREGTGWVAHLVLGYFLSTTSHTARYKKINISSSGTITHDALQTLSNTYSNGTTTAKMFPTIDFHHIGDGKTVASGTPHLYVAWSSLQTGSGHGIRFKKGTYATGAWTWGSEREIDSTRFCSDLTEGASLICLFDGARVIIAGMVKETVLRDYVIYQRDVADTTTTTLLVANDLTTPQMLLYGSLAVDEYGNLYLIGQHWDDANGQKDLVYRKWNRATGLTESDILINSFTHFAYANARRVCGLSGRLDVIYATGTVNPYTVNFEGVDV